MDNFNNSDESSEFVLPDSMGFPRDVPNVNFSFISWSFYNDNYFLKNLIDFSMQIGPLSLVPQWNPKELLGPLILGCG
jgi:hypothetical protein